MRRTAMALAVAVMGTMVAHATPDRLSYQGVLRDATGMARSGSFDMVFRFFDAASAGNEILVNRHEAAGTGPVVVSNGLFQVEVGAGVMIDGSALLPGDPYTTLGAVFKGFSEVWMEVQVGQGGSYETLSPRTHVVSAPFALHAASADSVGGVAAGDVLTTSATAQTKAGALQIDGNLTAGGNRILFGLGGDLDAIASRLTITGGNANADDLFLRAGNGSVDGGVEIHGAGPINLRSGSGIVNFMNDPTAAVTATLDAAGQLVTAGNIFTGGSFRFSTGPSAYVQALDTEMVIKGGDATTDDLLLYANLNSTMGSIEILGGGGIYFRSGDGSYNFLTPAGAALATLDGGGNFMPSGEYRFVNGARFTNALPTELKLIAGADATDILRLAGGDGSGEGEIIVGGSTFGVQFQSATGTFQFLDGPGIQRAFLDHLGNWSVSGNMLIKDDSLLFEDGPQLVGTSDALFLIGGQQALDSLYLTSGTGAASSISRLNLTGGGTAVLSSGGGAIILENNSTTNRAIFEPDGDFAVDGDLMANGNDLRFGFGAHLENGSSNTSLYAGLNLNLVISAGNGYSHGNIGIGNDGGIFFNTVTGVIDFGTVSGSPLADISAAGNFSAVGDLIAKGNEVHLGTPGSTRMVRNPATDDLYFARDEDQNQITSTFSIFTNVGVMQMRILDGDEAATAFDGAVNVNGIDYAEAFRISDPSLEPGDVVVFDTASPGFIARSEDAYSSLIAGVISGKPGFVTGNSFDAEEAADPVLAEEMKEAYAQSNYERAKELSLILLEKNAVQQRPVALAGRLPVKVDASYGPIKAGDHLTSSKTPGHAMAMTEPGPSLGVALESWDGPGEGVIMAFVQRGHYTPPALLAQTVATQQSLATSLAFRTPDPVSGVQMMPANLQVVLDSQGGEEARFSIFRDGSPSEPRAEMFRVDEKGNVWAQGAFRPRAMDLAEMFALSEPVEPGDVLVADRKKPGFYAKSALMGDPAVVGVVASDPGVILGADMSRLLAAQPDLTEALAAARAGNDRAAERRVWAELEKRFHATHAAVALSGTLKVKVDADYGAVEPGDLLIASPTPGHAMRAPSPAPEGAVIGKALESLDAGAGVIRMIVALR